MILARRSEESGTSTFATSSCAVGMLIFESKSSLVGIKLFNDPVLKIFERDVLVPGIGDSIISVIEGILIYGFKSFFVGILPKYEIKSFSVGMPNNGIL